MPIVKCPACGSTDDLQGQQTSDGVTVECVACRHTWRRDLTPTCTRCGSTDLVVVVTSTLEEAGRGEQRTPSGIREIHHCQDCGARDATSASPSDVPAPTGRRAAVTALAGTRGDDPAEPRSPRLADTRRVPSTFGVFAADQVIGGRWRLQTMVHCSSTGSLWLAKDLDGDRRILFRLVHPKLTTDRRVAALHVRAARDATRVRHPNLVPVLDVKVRDTDVLVVAHAVDGTPVDATTRLAPERLHRAAAVLARALAAMHAHESVHLDIRPSKLLLDAAGDVRLVDFGTGRVRAEHRIATSTGDRMAFQAPEQIVSRTHTPSADVYSLGLTLWSVAGGDLRAMGRTPGAQATHRLTHHVPRLDPDATSLPATFVDAIAAATLRPEHQRPTAAQFARMLESSAPTDG